IWKGGLNFGLVHIPVALYAAHKASEEISFHLIDSRDHNRVRYMRVNEETGKEVDWDDVVRGYEYEPGKYVVFTPEELRGGANPEARNAEIDLFVNRDDVAPHYFEQPYYLVPQKGGEKGYVILRDVLTRTGKAAVARVVMRFKEHLALVYPENGALMLATLRFS
ncbi:hypothetical protein KU546_23550, partial [Salmonella enterica subsp. enterica serovar Mbandaka]|nr:hypothetical protein [Salmonella enterica subsp. enterica serovar Mbandaka]